MCKKNITAAEINADFIAAQLKNYEAAAANATEKITAYFADLESRKAILTEQGDKIAEELHQLTTKREKMAADITDLSSRGMIDEAADLIADIEELNATISTMERKQKLISTTELKGDPELYKAAKAAQEAAEAERVPYITNIDALDKIVDAERERLESVSRELRFARDRNPARYAAAAFEKVNRHFYDLDRKDRELAAKAAAAREAEKKAAGAVSHTIVF